MVYFSSRPARWHRQLRLLRPTMICWHSISVSSTKVLQFTRNCIIERFPSSIQMAKCPKAQFTISDIRWRSYTWRFQKYFACTELPQGYEMTSSAIPGRRELEQTYIRTRHEAGA